mmetsp:Transcript_143284/g.248364  ORF Transcript_143284/g.248364 Transcript_143284/m.248364 type:complete len:543 (+) Transcript_143284:135-1763(+)
MVTSVARFFLPHGDALNSAEKASISRLVGACRHYEQFNLQTSEGADAAAAYLASLEAAANVLQIPSENRSYRSAFPLNYRSLFPGEARCYRVDVLEASIEHYNVMWVNGEKFEFSAEATQRAEALQNAWCDLGVVLDRWGRAAARGNSMSQANVSPRSMRPTRAELRTALEMLDSAWAGFEERYISELVDIEAKARSLIVTAIEREQRLEAIEKKHGEDCQDVAEYREGLELLVAAVARLNSVANVQRKGRDDLHFQVLVDAKDVLRRCKAASWSSEAGQAARILSLDVEESFQALRQYFRDVAHCLERVDPHLGNNQGLVDRLMDWEESWEVGTGYLQQRRVLDALCDAVADIKKAQRIAPKLASMCEECDVELFLVLPRLVWLRFLSKPICQVPLLARILPHHVSDSGSSTKGGSKKKASAPVMSKSLQGLLESYVRVDQQLQLAAPHGTASPEAGTITKEILVKKLVDSDADPAEVFGSLLPSHRQAVQARVDELLLELEGWSMELQRHCPEDWNQYSAVLVRCLQSDETKDRSRPFTV